MWTLKSPPKLRSYVDHRPHAVTEMFRRWNPKTYVDHWPGLTDMRRPLLKVPNGYVDHYARSGDMITMATLAGDEELPPTESPPATTDATLALDATAAPDILVTVIDATGWSAGDIAILQGNTYQVNFVDAAARTLQLHYVSGPTIDGTVIPVGTTITHG